MPYNLRSTHGGLSEPVVVFAAMRSRQRRSMRIESELDSGAGGEQARSADSGQR